MSRRVPRVTAKLGTVLDCTIAYGSKRHFVNEWRGFQLLTGEHAMDAQRPALYFVKGRLRGDPGVDAEAAAETYRRWHDRDPAKVGELDCADACPHAQGRMLRLGYRSDKWGKRNTYVDYDHDFLEDSGTAPLVYTNTRTLGAATTIVVVGGSMRVTERGIA